MIKETLHKDMRVSGKYREKVEWGVKRKEANNYITGEEKGNV